MTHIEKVIDRLIQFRKATLELSQVDEALNK